MIQKTKTNRLIFIPLTKRLQNGRPEKEAASLPRRVEFITLFFSSHFSYLSILHLFKHEVYILSAENVKHEDTDRSYMMKHARKKKYNKIERRNHYQKEGKEGKERK